MKFKDQKLIDPILKTIAEKGYEYPTKIQEEAIPKAMKRSDVLGIAQTGAGKTAIFSIPIIQLIYRLDGNKSKASNLRAHV